MSASKFIDTGSLGAPTVDIRVVSSSGKVSEKLLIAKQGADYVAQRENEPALYGLDAKTVDDLSQAASDVKPRPATGQEVDPPSDHPPPERVSNMTDAAIGIDFGTTNSSVALADPAMGVALATFPFAGEITDAYRSLLYLEQIKQQKKSVIKSWTGPEGIEHYLAADHKGRLIQSMKSFLTSRSLQTTEVFGQRRT